MVYILGFVGAISGVCFLYWYSPQSSAILFSKEQVGQKHFSKIKTKFLSLLFLAISITSLMFAVYGKAVFDISNIISYSLGGILFFVFMCIALALDNKTQ